MKRKNGFTLVELLAVIIILGVILLIVIPASLNTVDSSNKNTFTASAKALLNIAQTYVATEGVALPGEYGYVSIGISTLKFENKEAYDATGGVLIANFGTTDDPDYEFFVYLSNADYVVNGATRSKIKNSIKNKGTVAPYLAVTLPSSGNILVSEIDGITGHVENVTVAGGNYVTYHLD